MAIKIGDAYIDVLLNREQIDAQLADIESRLADVQTSASKAVSTANSASAATESSSGSIIDRIKKFASSGSLLGDDAQGALAALGETAGTEMLGGKVTSGFFGGGGGGLFGGLKTKAADAIGSSLMSGSVKGIDEGKSAMADAMRGAVDEAIKAGQDEAEIRSPSARTGRDLGGPMMKGIELQVLAGGQNVANAMVTSVNYAISKSAAELFGGSFIGRGVTNVSNPGGNFSGIGGYVDQFGQQVRGSFATGDPQSFGQASRILASNFPDKARDFGQNLLSGAVGSVLPGFAAGPVSDMLGTLLGTKPILTAEQALGASVSADAGGLSDSPFTGGQFVFNNNFNGAGNFTDTERDVQFGILQSMRRLGVGF